MVDCDFQWIIVAGVWDRVWHIDSGLRPHRVGGSRLGKVARLQWDPSEWQWRDPCGAWDSLLSVHGLLGVPHHDGHRWCHAGSSRAC